MFTKVWMAAQDELTAQDELGEVVDVANPVADALHPTPPEVEAEEEHPVASEAEEPKE
jgi:hypothetical protein